MLPVTRGGVTGCLHYTVKSSLSGVKVNYYGCSKLYHPSSGTSTTVSIGTTNLSEGSVRYLSRCVATMTVRVRE